MKKTRDPSVANVDRLDMQELFDTQVELLHKGIITSSSWLKVHRQPEDSHIASLHDHTTSATH